ncbi:MAG: AAA family ATPase [Thermodesulfobacteriota bacterium]
MKKNSPLSPSKLRLSTPARNLPANAEIRKKSAAELQKRALNTLNMSMHISSPGYNVYIAGEQGTGRTYFASSYLRPRANKMPTPPDLVYAYNFENADRPHCIALNPGLGIKMKRALAKCIQSIREAIPESFEQESYVQRKENLAKDFANVRDDLLQNMEKKANVHSFSLHTDENGDLTLYPLVEGKVLTTDEYERLDADLKQKLKKQSNEIMQTLLGMSRRLNLAEQGFKQNEMELERQVAAEQIDRFLNDMPNVLTAEKEIQSYLQAVKKDMLDNLDRFKLVEDSQDGGSDLHQLTGGPDFFSRYKINLFVDNSRQNGAPIVIENNPNYFNLLGCVERESEMGTYYTDFTLLKAGSLHRANGGFLILRAEDILSNISAWEGLLRALRSGQSRLEDPAEHYDLVRTRSLEPDPVVLNLKIILIGTDELYEILLEADDRFSKFFKLKAHMLDEVDRNADNTAALLSALQSMAGEISNRRLTREAKCALLDYASEMVGDQKKISLQLSYINDILIEADAASSMEGKKDIDAESVNFVRKSRIHRLNLYEDQFLEEYEKNIIKVSTDGNGVGCVNGLAVSASGDYIFALPHQITCTVGAGHGGVIDLEREAELGGPIHTKAILILKNYLQNLFAQDKPLIFSGSIYFEQSYAPVDGDSASAAELIALLSALSGVPVRYSLAMTGALSHSGEIMAVGEVTRKIEGFYEVCVRRGLSGKHGVIIPADNVDNLMLNKKVVQACRNGLFSIYSVEHINQALEILTGIKAGRRLKDGRFSRHSIYSLVDEKLRHFAYLAEKKARRQKRRKNASAE